MLKANFAANSVSSDLSFNLWCKSIHTQKFVVLWKSCVALEDEASAELKRVQIARCKVRSFSEVDEMCNFVGCKAQKRWLWIAIRLRKRQIIAFVMGDRSEEACQKFLGSFPEDYRNCLSYSDFWAFYKLVFPQMIVISRWRKNWSIGSCGAMEQHAWAEVGSVCAQGYVLFQV